MAPVNAAVDGPTHLTLSPIQRADPQTAGPPSDDSRQDIGNRRERGQGNRHGRPHLPPPVPPPALRCSDGQRPPTPHLLCTAAPNDSCNGPPHWSPASTSPTSLTVSAHRLRHCRCPHPPLVCSLSSFPAILPVLSHPLLHSSFPCPSFIGILPRHVVRPPCGGPRVAVRGPAVLPLMCAGVHGCGLSPRDHLQRALLRVASLLRVSSLLGAPLLEPTSEATGTFPFYITAAEQSTDPYRPFPLPVYQLNEQDAVGPRQHRPPHRPRKRHRRPPTAVLRDPARTTASSGSSPAIVLLRRDPPPSCATTPPLWSCCAQLPLSRAACRLPTPTSRRATCSWPRTLYGS